jgi:predicted transcriptional regulator
MACTRQGAEVWPSPLVGGQSLRRALQVKPSVRPTWDTASGLAIQRRRLVDMGSSTSRDQILEALQDLPSDATFDDAIERLIFLAKIDAGLNEIDAGKGIPHDEVKRQLSQ